MPGPPREDQIPKPKPKPKPFRLHTSGSLNLDTGGRQVTLEDIEEFCEEARRLGLPGGTILRPYRQGSIGQITSWHFDVPVQPKGASNGSG